MKILNLKIKDKSNNIIRDIDFNETGISFIFGDIQEPQNPNATINSLGKTLLIKFIDYIYGANEDTTIVKNDLNNYSLDATITHNHNKYNITRKLGNSKEISINNEIYSLVDYKKFFNIQRSLYNKQIILKKKSHEISYQTKPNKEDVIKFLELLNLKDILYFIDEIYFSQDAIQIYKKSKTELITFYGNFDVKQIDEEIYFVDKEVKRLTHELDIISNKIQSIEISEMQINVVEEYANKSSEFKKVKSDCEKAKLEYKRLTEFIDNSDKVDITSEHILAIYEKAVQEIPELIKRKIQDVEIFHQKVFNERKDFLNRKKAQIQKVIENSEEQIYKLSHDIDKLGKLISINQVYQESIKLYEKYTNDLQALKYKEGKLSQVKNIDDNIKKEDLKLTTNFDSAGQIIQRYKDLITEYQEFIESLTQAIYEKNISAYFDIKIRRKHQKTRPVLLEMKLKGDTGEGVGEVKKNLIDYLLFRYNKYMDFLIQDSACYNGIDPRQVISMLQEVDKIAKDTNKQVIIAINKYQLGEYLTILEIVKKNSSIILSEKDKLMKFDF